MKLRRQAEAGTDTSDADSGQPSEQLNLETLRQWQSDLDGFVSQIRARLKTLSQAMKNHRLRRKSHAPPAPLETQSINPADPHADPAGPPSSPAAPIQEEDPLAQLDAIKRRLAEQLENS